MSKLSLNLTTVVLVAVFASIFFSGPVYAESLSQAPPNPLVQDDKAVQQQNKVVTKKATELSSTAQKLQDLQNKKQALADQLAAQQQKIADLKQQIADKKAAEAQAAQAAQVKAQPAPVQQASVPVGGIHYNCGDNYYAAYIYGNESGGHVVGNCDTGARNGGGCLGIGQACPGSKLLAVCPNLDYDCENSFFTGYANSAYGGWAGAYAFWQGHGWW